MSNNQELVSSLCHSLYTRGQALIPGTGVAVKDGDQVFIPPGEIHLNRLETEDVFTFNVEFDSDGNPDLNKDAINPCHNISAYTNLYLKIFQEFDCGCVIYAQPTSATIVAEIFDNEFKIKNHQLITQITNGGTGEQYPWTHELKVPIIKNPDDQTKLFSVLEKSFSINPETNAVIVKGNGIVVCGDSWQEAKLMFDTLLQLFDVAIELRKIKGLVKTVTAVDSNKNDDDIAVVHESKPVKKSPTKAPPPATEARKVIKPPLKTDFKSSLKTDTRLRPSSDDSYRSEALKRKKLALTRLRERSVVSRDIRNRDDDAGSRRNAASFMNSMSNNMNSMNNMGMNDMNAMNNMNNMNGMNMNMGMNNMNSMNDMTMNSMNSMNDMAMNSMMMGMNNQMMGGAMNMMGSNMNNGGMFTIGATNMNNMDNDMNNGHRGVKRSSIGRGRGSRGRASVGASRKGFSPRNKGNVKDRLGFKSNISVDPTLLNQGDVNTEDY